MAHQINYNKNTGKHSFFSVREKAWHGLGTIVEDYPTSSEAIKFAGLDFTVEKRPLFTPNALAMDLLDFSDTVYLGGGNEGIFVPDSFATVRADTQEVLGVVGRDYRIVQNVDAFAFFDAIVGGGDGIKYETAGCLGKGERTFITAKLPDYIRVGRNDCIEKYLFLSTTHDGSGSITAAFTPIRICCQNTLNAAMKNLTNFVRIKHTAGAVDRLREAHKLLGISNLLANEMEEVFNRWSRVKITDKYLKQLIQVAVAPNRETLEAVRKGKEDGLSTLYQNMVEQVMEYASASTTQQMETTKGTLFGAYNAVTGYHQNLRNYKDDESKFKSIMYGTGLKHNQTAFDLCTAFAKMGADALN
ncbi:DUF945 domain-containing protein [Pedobacter sp. ISL-68]|uniref:DUF932 domain-containing protein n=1 Tax=unclassified Pedobacter TaxID=2628915 RepID=UPI001BE88838|nr:MULTISPECIES: DUF932 domain-containing protein [unclassified Pedobacter]MBT2564664.1 DUF945 domain-containing protein [Pedobacter sp. ISL-64]MBT2593663.1 DUF945 domain-containing protein [Pedobacter sp. ISL-68]